MAAAAYSRKQQQGPEESNFSSSSSSSSSNARRRRPIMEEEEEPYSSSSFDQEFETPSRSRSSSSSSSSSGSRSNNIINPLTSTSSSLAAKAIRASSAHMDSSLSSAYLLSPSSPSPSSSSAHMVSNPYEYTSMKNMNESKHGFWGALARKAKAILDDDHVPITDTPATTRLSLNPDTASKYRDPYPTTESHRKSDGPTPTLQKGLGAIASSLNSIGGAIGNALEEGFTVVENRTADIIQETRKLHIRKKGTTYRTENQVKDVYSTRQQPSLQNQMQPQIQTDQDIQLKASRDVAMAMATKAKLLLRELKTVKADLAFAKDRCAQLEEENRILRENREKGSNLEDDDLIRLQLETLLAEKARLAQENSVYARENRFLREVVEYHQLTMQDVVYLNEGTEEVTEVHPIRIPSVSLQVNQHDFPVPMPPVELSEVSKNAALQGSDSINIAEDSKSRSIPST